MIFDVAPYERAGPIRFGMARDEVTEDLGPARIDTRPGGELALDYGGTRVFISEGKVVEVTFLPDQDVRSTGGGRFCARTLEWDRDGSPA